MNVYVKDSRGKPQACVIWMHGIGADAEDMAGLADQLSIEGAVRHVFMNAPMRPVTLNNNMLMRAWYDIIGLNLMSREDREGILQSEGMIREVIGNQLADGFVSEQIFLSGFSQGGAMALFTGLKTSEPLAGIIALSTYLPLAAECNMQQPKNIPIFMASGRTDPIVLPGWTKKSVEYLRAQDYQKLFWQEYSMEHAVCSEEIKDLSEWLTTKVSAMTCSLGEVR